MKGDATLAKPLDHQIADEVHVALRPQTRPPMASPWPRAALVIGVDDEVDAEGVRRLRERVANVLSAIVSRPCERAIAAAGRQVREGEVGVRGGLDGAKARVAGRIARR